MNSINTDTSVAPATPSAGRATPAPRASSSADSPTLGSTQASSAQSVAKPDPPKPTKSPDELALQMNHMLEQRESSIRFEIDRTSHPSQVITQIVDKNTKEVLRQFPSEEMIRLSDSMDDAQFLGSHDVPLVKTQA